jgi:biopolymer transport protein ExbB
MLIDILAAASDSAAPAAEFGFGPALKQGGAIAYTIMSVLVIMSVGSFYILFTKFYEQNRIFRQFKTVRSSFWRANTLSEGATKLEKNSAWRQLVDDALAAESQHSKMVDSMEAHDWLHGSLDR